jgi:hypothetical protein
MGKMKATRHMFLIVDRFAHDFEGAHCGSGH